jgi:hypothetical protein
MAIKNLAIDVRLTGHVFRHRDTSEHRIDNIVFRFLWGCARKGFPARRDAISLEQEIFENEGIHTGATESRYCVHYRTNDRLSAQIQGRIEQDWTAGTVVEMRD